MCPSHVGARTRATCVSSPCPTNQANPTWRTAFNVVEQSIAVTFWWAADNRYVGSCALESRDVGFGAQFGGFYIRTSLYFDHESRWELVHAFELYRSARCLHNNFRLSDSRLCVCGRLTPPGSTPPSWLLPAFLIPGGARQARSTMDFVKKERWHEQVLELRYGFRDEAYFRVLVPCQRRDTCHVDLFCLRLVKLHSILRSFRDLDKDTCSRQCYQPWRAVRAWPSELGPSAFYRAESLLLHRNVDGNLVA